SRPRASAVCLRGVPSPRGATRQPRRRFRERDRRDAPLRAGRHAHRIGARRLREGARLSRLRAKCPDCRAYTAVALGPDYECHACARTFAAGLVRVRRAWGKGGDAMVEAANLQLPYPEALVVEEGTLGEQTLAIAAELPERPLVLGGCCCAHIGPIQALSHRCDRLAVVWLDAHGDLNTPGSSVTGNAWGMALRIPIDAGAVRPEDVALVGARNLDPPEEVYIASTGLHAAEFAVERAIGDADAVYVAIDIDAFDPAEVSPFFPEPGGLSVAEGEALLDRLRRSADVVGVGFSGLP